MICCGVNPIFICATSFILCQSNVIFRHEFDSFVTLADYINIYDNIPMPEQIFVKSSIYTSLISASSIYKYSCLFILTWSSYLISVLSAEYQRFNLICDDKINFSESKLPIFVWSKESPSQYRFRRREYFRPKCHDFCGFSHYIYYYHHSQFHNHIIILFFA